MRSNALPSTGCIAATADSWGKIHLSELHQLVNERFYMEQRTCSTMQLVPALPLLLKGRQEDYIY